MPRYRVIAKNTEYLLPPFIEAPSKRAARDLFIEDWEQGRIPVADSKITFMQVKEVEDA